MYINASGYWRANKGSKNLSKLRKIFILRFKNIWIHGIEKAIKSKFFITSVNCIDKWKMEIKVKTNKLGRRNCAITHFQCETLYTSR